MLGTSLAVPWSRLHASIAGGMSSIPGQGTKVLNAAPCGQKKEPRRPSPVLAVARLPKAGKEQPVHHTGLEQKLGGPEAQSSSHKGHGCHPKRRPHKTPAERENG